RVRELVAARVEELDAVVLRRVVRRRDDDPEVEPGECDRGRWKDAPDDRVRAARDDAAHERSLELRARTARITPDEDAPRAGPSRRSAAEPFDEVRGERLSDDPPDAVGSEVPARHAGGDTTRPLLTRVEEG